MTKVSCLTIARRLAVHHGWLPHWRLVHHGRLAHGRSAWKVPHGRLAHGRLAWKVPHGWLAHGRLAHGRSGRRRSHGGLAHGGAAWRLPCGLSRRLSHRWSPRPGSSWRGCTGRWRAELRWRSTELRRRCAELRIAGCSPHGRLPRLRRCTERRRSGRRTAHGPGIPGRADGHGLSDGGRGCSGRLAGRRRADRGHAGGRLSHRDGRLHVVVGRTGRTGRDRGRPRVRRRAAHRRGRGRP